MRFIPTRAVAVAAAALLALTACSAGSSTTSGSSPGGDQSLSLGLVAEPASLDFTTTDGAAIPQVLLGNVYETLVKQDDSGKIVPSLAKSWTVSPDRKTYTFDLVDNAKFTSDKPFTAADAVFSINRVKTRLDHVAEGRDGRRLRREGVVADAAPGDADASRATTGCSG